MPCYHSEKFVLDAIHSVVAQTYGNIELILAPDDNQTYQFLRHQFTAAQLRILTPPSQSKTGPGAARNRAINAATGDFFTMLDSDDYLPNNYIERLMKIALEEGSAIAPAQYVSWDFTKKIRETQLPSKTLEIDTYAQQLSSIHPLIHRSLEIGYPNGLSQDVMHDAIILGKTNGISCVTGTNYIIRIREGSITNTGEENAEKHIQEAYQHCIDLITYHPCSVNAQSLNQTTREEIAELFRFRVYVSQLFGQSKQASYHEWVCGQEAMLWDDFKNLS